MDKRAPPDWQVVQRDYRTGRYTLRELEKLHHVSKATINRKATAGGWTKDLAKPIKEATKAIILKTQRDESDKSYGVPQVIPYTAADSDEELVQVAAHDAAKVILVHRKDINPQRKLGHIMLQELMLITQRPEDILKLALDSIDGKRSANTC